MSNEWPEDKKHFRWRWKQYHRSGMPKEYTYGDELPKVFVGAWEENPEFTKASSMVFIGSLKHSATPSGRNPDGMCQSCVKDSTIPGGWRCTVGGECVTVSNPGQPSAQRAEQPAEEARGVEYTKAIGDAGEAYMAQFKYAHPLPAQFRWSDLWDAMQRAALLAAPAAGTGQEPVADTGNAEADRIIERLMSADPDFDDCTVAAAFIRRIVAEHKGPEGFATWREAAIAERVRRVKAEQAAPSAGGNGGFRSIAFDESMMREKQADTRAQGLTVKQRKTIEAVISDYEALGYTKTPQILRDIIAQAAPQTTNEALELAVAKEQVKALRDALENLAMVASDSKSAREYPPLKGAIFKARVLLASLK